MEPQQYMNMPMPPGDVRVGGYASYGPRVTEVVPGQYGIDTNWNEEPARVDVRPPVGEESPEFWGVYVGTYDKALESWVWEWRADFAEAEHARLYCQFLAWQRFATACTHV
jgi:hypothetical protein